MRLALELLLVAGLGLVAIGGFGLVMSLPWGWWTSTERKSVRDDPYFAWWWVRQRGNAARLALVGVGLAGVTFAALLLIWGPDT